MARSGRLSVFLAESRLSEGEEDPPLTAAEQGRLTRDVGHSSDWEYFLPARTR